MPDRRPVDDLSIEELERVLALKKREARQKNLRRMRTSGRVIDTASQSASQPVAPAYENDPAEKPKAQPPQLEKRKAVPQFEDAIDAREYRKPSNKGRIWRSFVERSLLLVEIAAVIGLVVLGVALFNGLTTLESETAQAQADAEALRVAGIPTPVPTPQLSLENVVLPTGHTFLNDQPVFNFGEVPESMQGLARTQIYLPASVARPPATDNTPLRVLIPDINVDNSIVQGVDWAALQQGVGMLPNGAIPTNDTDNVVLAAHNDIYGELFRDLDQLEVGDEIQVQTRSGFYTYIVRESLIVEPDDVYVMDSQGTAMVTLISCYPYRVNNQRFIVHADRVDA